MRRREEILEWLKKYKARYEKYKKKYKEYIIPIVTEVKKTPFLLPFKLLIPLLIFLQAYHPSFLAQFLFKVKLSLILTSIGIGILIAVLIYVVGVVVASVVLKRFLPQIANLIVSIVIILTILFVVPWVCNTLTGRNSPNYYEIVLRMKTIKIPPLILVTQPIFPGIVLTAKSIALFSLIVGTLIILLISLHIKSFPGLFAFSGFLLFALYFAPIILFAQPWAEKYLFPLQSNVFLKSSEIVTIPTKGGIDIKFGKEEAYYQPTLMAGYDYYSSFTVTNNYERGISFSYTPFIEVLYKGSEIKFTKSINSLKLEKEWTKEEPLTFKSDELTLVGTPCPYPTSTLANYYGILEEEVECSGEKGCAVGKCLKIASMICECANWEKVTCNGDLARLGIEYSHDGFLKGKATLYYTKEEYQEVPIQKYVQGPITVYVTFYPNPWIEKIYGEEDKAILRFEAEGNGDIIIDKIKVDSAFAQVVTSITGYSSEIGDVVNFTLIENVSLEKIECKPILDEVPSGEKVVIHECYFKPPSVTLVLMETEKLDLSYEEEITYENIDEYCETGFRNKLIEVLGPKIGGELSKVLRDKSTLCRIKAGEEAESKGLTEEEFKEIVGNMLRFIDVMFEIEYTRDATAYSLWVDIYRDTPICAEIT
jgi:hypothetical protein